MFLNFGMNCAIRIMLEIQTILQNFLQTAAMVNDYW